MIGDVFSVLVFVLQDLVDRPELQLGRAGQVSAVRSVARRFPAGAHVQLARTEQFWNYFIIILTIIKPTPSC